MDIHCGGGLSLTQPAFEPQSLLGVNRVALLSQTIRFRQYDTNSKHCNGLLAASFTFVDPNGRLSYASLLLLLFSGEPII